MATIVPHWVAHTGEDYTVVMLGDETTDNASIRVYGNEPEDLGKLIADALNLMTDLAVAAGKIRPEGDWRTGIISDSHEDA